METTFNQTFPGLVTPSSTSSTSTSTSTAAAPNEPITIGFGNPGLAGTGASGIPGWWTVLAGLGFATFVWNLVRRWVLSCRQGRLVAGALRLYDHEVIETFAARPFARALTLPAAARRQDEGSGCCLWRRQRCPGLSRISSSSFAVEERGAEHFKTHTVA
ncbi:hypothetical protein PG997_001975 [Apiospora hydei]|uniref:Uncharacterized protein n=1 Tax=Apiospora hydei TaxID=1337664 RepID=A0ABR1X817_9PEZI